MTSENSKYKPNITIFCKDEDKDLIKARNTALKSEDLDIETDVGDKKTERMLKSD